MDWEGLGWELGGTGVETEGTWMGTGKDRDGWDRVGGLLGWTGMDWEPGGPGCPGAADTPALAQMPPAAVIQDPAWFH